MSLLSHNQLDDVSSLLCTLVEWRHAPPLWLVLADWIGAVSLEFMDLMLGIKPAGSIVSLPPGHALRGGRGDVLYNVHPCKMQKS